jgi:hypothetical protein
MSLLLQAALTEWKVEDCLSKLRRHIKCLEKTIQVASGTSKDSGYTAEILLIEQPNEVAVLTRHWWQVEIAGAVGWFG